jgi:hypothetical protein
MGTIALRHTLLPLVLLLASPAAAQSTTITLPTAFGGVTTSNIPVAAPPGRFQQWFSPGEWMTAVGHPVRVTGLDLIAGSPGGQAGAQIDIEVIMANGPASGPGLFMDANLANPLAPLAPPPVTVAPRGVRTLGTAIPGSFPLRLTFATPFVWDGVSGVVVDIKLFDNGKGNQAYQYHLLATSAAANRTTQLWGFNPDPRTVINASAVTPGQGLVMQFTTVEGATVSFGQGCPGAGGAVPLASTTGGPPLPANPAWTHVVSQANAQIPALLILGVDRTMYAGIPLPLDLSVIHASGCFLFTDIVTSIQTTTLGGGAGAGSASIVVPTPPVTLRGLEMFTQWLLLDPGAPNGVVSMSQALRHVFG